MLHAVLIVLLSLLGQPPLDDASATAANPAGGDASSAALDAAATDAVTVDSVWDFVVKGGIVMAPIGLCSLVMLAILVERLIVLRRRQIVPAGFDAELRALASGDAALDLPRVGALCAKHDSPVARIVAAGARRLGAGGPGEAVEKDMRYAGEQEVVQLRKRLRGLSVITSVAPLLGLLGTIFGMIKAFQTVATSGDALGRTELLAEGIYEAMITTAAGLIVAIPALVAYHALASRIDRLVREMDRIGVEFVERFAVRRDGGSPASSAATHAESVASEPTPNGRQHERATPDPAAEPSTVEVVALAAG